MDGEGQNLHHQRARSDRLMGLTKWALLELTFLGLCLLGQEVNGRILIYRRETNQLIEEFNDLPAAFGPSIPPSGIKVFAVPAMPKHYMQYKKPNYYACDKIMPPPRSGYPPKAKYVAIIQRGGNCTFEKKVRIAQAASFNATIIFNNDGDDLEQMSAENSTGIHIPSFFVGQSAGESLLSFFVDEVIIVINDELPFNINTQLIIPFSILIGLCFLIMIGYMLYRCIREDRRMRRNLLPKKMLKKLPILKFTKNTRLVSDTCVICLDEFAEGDKIRILPCRHPYHSNCIDPWLTQNRRICPICKRKVFTKYQVRRGWNRHPSLSDLLPDTDDDTTPLLQQSRNSAPQNNSASSSASASSTSTQENGATRHGTFRRSSTTTSNLPLTSSSNLSENHSANELPSDDENALLVNGNANNRGRINPFDRSRNSAQQDPQPETESRFNIFRFFRRRRAPLSVSAPPFNDRFSNDVESQPATTGTSQTIATQTTTAGPGVAGGSMLVSNNECLKDASNVSTNNDDDNSSTDELPHHNIYEPINEATGFVEGHILSPNNPSPFFRGGSTAEGVVDETAVENSNNVATNETDSMFFQTPTHGNIGVVALPNSNISSEDLLVIRQQQQQQQQQQQEQQANNPIHQRYRRGFLI